MEENKNYNNERKDDNGQERNGGTEYLLLLNVIGFATVALMFIIGYIQHS